MTDTPRISRPGGLEVAYPPIPEEPDPGDTLPDEDTTPVPEPEPEPAPIPEGEF